MSEEPANPYQPPAAVLDVPPPPTGLPANIDNAVAGGYDFTIGEVMDEAWQLVDGMKARFWGAAVVVGLIYLAFETICSVIFGMFMTRAPGQMTKQIFNDIVGALATPLTMGISMMCVQRALDEPISFATAFSYFGRARTALAAAFLVVLFSYLGSVALILPGIYLMVGYRMTIQLVGDQGLSAGEAMRASRRAIHHHWWRVFGLMLLVGLITAASALLILIPLVWTIPWAYMTSAVLYRRIFYAPMPDARLNVRA